MAADVLMEKPESPLSIPSWLWLTLITLFMVFVLWLCLRNATQVLPVRIQQLLQAGVDKTFGQGRIRLLEDIPDGPDRGPSIPLHLGDSEDEDDDELPLATVGRRREHQRPQEGQFSRILSLVSGRSRRSHNNYESLEPESERVLDLPRHNNGRARNFGRPAKLSLATSNNTYSPSSTTSRSQSLFRQNSWDADAASLPSNFAMPGQQLPSSPSLDRQAVAARSPLRSPALSRTPSLLAIVEETSVSPRSSTDAKEGTIDLSLQSHNIRRQESVSSTSSEQELPDWASAVTSNSHAAPRQQQGAGIRMSSSKYETQAKGFASALQGS